jgi:hypothetical protein
MEEKPQYALWEKKTCRPKARALSGPSYDISSWMNPELFSKPEGGKES